MIDPRADVLRQRPTVDVVVPFHGADRQLDDLLGALCAMRLRPTDSLVVVDNGPPSATRGPRKFGASATVIVERGIASSYYARNRGASVGGAEWILFLDADVRPPENLLDLYFMEAPEPGDGILAGAVEDEVLAEPAWRSPAARYAQLRTTMSQENTFADDRWRYAQTANCAVRRTAFEEIGGFTEDIRSGGDADLCFRLRDAGWALRPRGQARAVHRTRRTLRALLRQKARHGSGADWLNRRYPGSFPPELKPGWVLWAGRQVIDVAKAALRRDADAAVLLGVDLLTRWAFELGRLTPNHVKGAPAKTR